jgi:hypothetical protein
MLALSMKNIRIFNLKKTTVFSRSAKTCRRSAIIFKDVRFYDTTILIAITFCLQRPRAAQTRCLAQYCQSPSLPQPLPYNYSPRSGCPIVVKICMNSSQREKDTKHKTNPLVFLFFFVLFYFNLQTHALTNLRSCCWGVKWRLLCAQTRYIGVSGDVFFFFSWVT